MKKISGNKLLVKALKEEGVDILFGYPGACTIDISDEIYKQDYTKVVLPRHEQALVHAADAYARSTGKVGVCLVTSGPGATNLVTGIATAKIWCDSKKERRSGKNHQRGILYCAQRTSGSGSCGSPERCNGRAWKPELSGDSQYPRI